MKVIIEIDCDNAAFDGSPYRELKRILGTIPHKVVSQVRRKVSSCEALESDDVLMDINGNTVGSVRVIF